MAKDDFDVLAYKLLAYLYACLKAGVEASVPKAREVAACNDRYWDAIVEDLSDAGLVKAMSLDTLDGKILLEMRITMEGAAYLDGNSRMARARELLGAAFAHAVEVAVAVTSAI